MQYESHLLAGIYNMGYIYKTLNTWSYNNINMRLVIILLLTLIKQKYSASPFANTVQYFR